MTTHAMIWLVFWLLSAQAWAASLATPEWQHETGEAVLQPAPFPDAAHAEGLLVTANSGRIFLLAPGGQVLSTMRLDLPAGAAAIPVRFQPSAEARIVAADVAGSIYCFDRNGRPLWKYARDGKATDYRVLSVADLTGSGARHIVFSDSRGNLYAVDAQGRLRFEVTTTTFRLSAAAAADLDGDGRDEIVFGTEDSEVYALHTDGGVLWRAELPAMLGRTLPLISWFGKKQAVLVSTPFVAPFQGIYALDAATGGELWSAPSLLQTYQSTAVADLDGDGAPEILYGDKSTRVFCADGQGHPRWNVQLDGRGIFFAPAVADLEGSGEAVLFAVVRGAGVNRKSLYAIDADGHVAGSWELPGGGSSGPVLCRWRNQPEIHLLAGAGSGRIVSYRLTQDPRARILWSGVQEPAKPAATLRSRPPEARAPARRLTTSLGTTTLTAGSKGASLVAFRVVDPDGVVHLTLRKPEKNQPVHAALLAARPGEYEVTTRWYPAGAAERTVYRAGTVLEPAVLVQSGDLSAGLQARVSAARMRALSSGRPADYDVARQEAAYAHAVLEAVAKVRPSGPLMIRQLRNPWAQHTPVEMLSAGAADGGRIEVRMLGNEYESAAIVLTNVTSRPLTVDLRSVLPIEFRAVPLVIPNTTGEPQEDPLPLLEQGQLVHLDPAGTAEIWLTVHSRALKPGTHTGSIQAAVLERFAAPLEIPLDITVSRVRLPDRFTYRHCNWLSLAAISDERLLDATIRDAVEHGTNVFNIPGPTVSVNCIDRVTGGDSAAADRLIRRLPGAFFLVNGSVNLKWPAACLPDRAGADQAYKEALAWFANHMRERGLDYADYALYPQDEPGLMGQDAAFVRYVESVKRVKSADPRMQVYANPAGGAMPEVLAPLAGLVDIWCPDLHLFRLHPAEFTNLFRQARQFWHYEAPSDQRRLDPLGFYRMKPWIAFQLGMQGGGYWVYSETDYWKPDPARATEYGVVYPGPLGPATSKRWEASRDGSEDYELLTMLRRAAGQAQSPAGPKALVLIREAVAFVTRGQEEASDIGRQLRPYAPDFPAWMNYRARLINAAEELIP